MKNRPTTPASLDALATRAHQLEDQTLGQLAAGIGLCLPETLHQHKGLAGQLIEFLLGTDAGNQSRPDFTQLGIELKTIPVNATGKPKESTYVCTVPLQQRPFERFENSIVCAKLSHVLWVPIHAEGTSIADWRIRRPVFWQPTEAEWQVLRTDFDELMDAIALGGLAHITSRLGEALHIRPKAADGKQLTACIGESGTLEPTLPRGFYLRTGFTAALLR